MIRAARTQDATAIAAVWNGIIETTTVTFASEPKSVAAVTELIAERPVLVAERAGAVAGFATFGPFRGGSGYRHTAELTVHLTEAARGQGLGRRLVAALEAEAAGQGVHVLVAAISAENAGALAFHARLGFEEAGRLAEVGRKFGRWLDLVLMQKRL
ncbi:phosphinothricin N-acetyltransferase, putative [Oceanicola granulosus HTCC2516]|uniref:Phosphinothricin N-acetyltransferase, putative n=1 Tax=Oceanicola granulosus (strain ATCC BAA-861 / DSM 15982 / KCTC 12143 / HTCC2516) TaxID=314256 RepID=Q2CAJ4_OCEGH|nr:GNAT family N-acetyltransferase [Oceanicola granulosus]EAR49680.1 phosphinothricin N-acetyltransferase, putative [Oceanicola granulosus HTCC2516]